MISKEGMRPSTVFRSCPKSWLQKGIESGRWIRDDFDMFFHVRVWNSVGSRSQEGWLPTCSKRFSFALPCSFHRPHLTSGMHGQQPTPP